MCSKFLKQWQIGGTRRPFPSMSDAIKKYGAENVFFDAPVYEKKNQCPWCGKEVNNKRRRFCCDACREKFNNMTVWHRRRDAYSLRILYRDKFVCQDCGEFHAFINKHGMPIPIDDGQLQVHHIIPVADGGGDEQQNLVTLCKACHKKRHDILRQNKKKLKTKVVKDSAYEGDQKTSGLFTEFQEVAEACGRTVVKKDGKKDTFDSLFNSGYTTEELFT